MSPDQPHAMFYFFREHVTRVNVNVFTRQQPKYGLVAVNYIFLKADDGEVTLYHFYQWIITDKSG